MIQDAKGSWKPPVYSKDSASSCWIQMEASRDGRKTVRLRNHQSCDSQRGLQVIKFSREAALFIRGGQRDGSHWSATNTKTTGRLSLERRDKVVRQIFFKLHIRPRKPLISAAPRISKWINGAETNLVSRMIWQSGRWLAQSLLCLSHLSRPIRSDTTRHAGAQGFLLVQQPALANLTSLWLAVAPPLQQHTFSAGPQQLEAVNCSLAPASIKFTAERHVTE